MVTSAIVNVVATASLDQQLDLHMLEKFREIFHNSDVYRGRAAYFKTSSMEGSVSIFSSGKMISAGTKSEQRAVHELEAAMKFLVEKGIVRKVNLDPKIRNLVVVADFAKVIDIEKMAEKPKRIYEPEQFPGMIIRINEPYKFSALLFTSGKIVIVGLKSSEQIKPALKRLEEILSLET